VFGIWVRKCPLLQGGVCPHHLDQGCMSLGKEKARLERILKMKTVRMTALMAFCFTICQVTSPKLIRQAISQ
jgi:hypothetical protein